MAELEGQLADAQSQRATAIADLSAVQAERDAAQVFFFYAQSQRATAIAALGAVQAGCDAALVGARGCGYAV